MNVIDQTKKLLADLDYTLQPIVILRKDGTTQTVCHELLLRSPNDTNVSLELLKLVNGYEQANQLFLMWKKKLLYQLFKKHHEYQICINFTPQQLSYRNTWQFLAEFRAQKEHLRIEITEDKFNDSRENLHTQLITLKSFGYKIVLDDIGHGQNTYELIRENISEVISLKISLLRLTDMSLEAKLLFVKAWNQYAKEHGVTLVVEGVENAKVAAKVAKIGCLQQGYYWCAQKTSKF